MTPENLEKPVTLKILMDFFDQIVEPRFIRLMDECFTAFESRMNQGFDDLYKKYEKLDQEYEVIKHQLKRMDQRFERFEQDLSGVKKDLEQIKKELSDVKRGLEKVEVRLKNLEDQYSGIKTLSSVYLSHRKFLEEELNQIKSQLSSLNHRIELLEQSPTKSK